MNKEELLHNLQTMSEKSVEAIICLYHCLKNLNSENPYIMCSNEDTNAHLLIDNGFCLQEELNEDVLKDLSRDQIFALIEITGISCELKERAQMKTYLKWILERQDEVISMFSNNGMLLTLSGSAKINRKTLCSVIEAAFAQSFETASDSSTCPENGTKADTHIAEPQKKSKKTKLSQLTPTTTTFDPTTPVFEKIFVFTGKMEHFPDVITAAQIVYDMGGYCKDAVVSDIDYLVLGNAGYQDYEAGHLSTKTKKALHFIEQGSHIHIISEDEFCLLIGNTSEK